MSAELAARVTAAQAALGDYKAELGRWFRDDGPQPAWQYHADRLAAELHRLLEALGEQPDPGDAAKLAAIRDVLAHFDWEFHDRQLALERIEEIAGS
jgi:hypothetical protein